MDYSDIRKHLKKGELATEALEKLGFVYSTKEGEHPHWVAPVKPIDGLAEQIQALIDAAVKKAQAEDPRGPNWHLVAGYVGKDFMVRAENLPVWHHMREYATGPHFRGKHYHAIKIEYRRDPSYTGYAVYFNFATRPYRPEIVWIPLSACAFRP